MCLSLISISGSSDEEIGPKLEEAAEKAEVEELKRDDSWRKQAPVREWDKGKTGKTDQASKLKPFMNIMIIVILSDVLVILVETRSNNTGQILSQLH